MSDEKKTIFGVGAPVLDGGDAGAASDDASAATADEPKKPKSVKSKLAALAIPKPGSAAPKSTAPKSTAPKSTAPKSTAPKSTAPKSTVPKSTAPKSTAPESTAPESTAPESTAPEAAEPESTEPAAPESKEEAPKPKTTAPLGSATRSPDPTSPGAATQPDEDQLAAAAAEAVADAPKSVVPKSVAPPDHQQIVKPSGFPTVDDAAKTIVPGMQHAVALAVNPKVGGAAAPSDEDQAKTLVPGAMSAHPGVAGAQPSGDKKRDMMAAAVGLPPPPAAPDNIDDMAKTLVPGQIMAPSIKPPASHAGKDPSALADVPTTPSGEVELKPKPMQAGHVSADDVGFAKTLMPGVMMAPAVNAVTTGARQAPVAVPIATPPTNAGGVATTDTDPQHAPAAAAAPASAAPAPAVDPHVGRVATPAPDAVAVAKPMALTGPEMPAVDAAAAAASQQQPQPQQPALTELGSEQMVIGSAPTERSGIDGLTLHEGERLIAVEKPGAFFWGLFVIFLLMVITIPIALWMLLGATGRQYVITNRRSIRISRGGKLSELPHDKLDRYAVSGFMGASNVSLKLIPKQGSGAQPLTFGLCGPMGAMARLWGVIYFWVLGEHVDVNDAPEVDTDGKLALTLHALDIAIFDDTMYRKGVNLTQMQQRGATVFTPTRVIWLREQDFGTDGKVHAAMPVYGFLQSVAQRAPTVEAFEQEVERVARGGGLAEVMSREWSTLSDFKYGKLKGLSYVDGKDQKRAHIVIPGRYEQAVQTYLGKLGINPS
ncbi:MAG: hypothetical protein KC503_38730 [Myxococcales bacterium]|nr:hypothetical protein [Myxococcales bacterium]